MGKGTLCPPLNGLGVVLRTVLPKHAAKHLENELGCTPRQARRMAYGGRVPGRFRARLIEYLDRSIARNIAELEEVRAELRGIGRAEMLARVQGRRVGEAGPAQEDLPGLDDWAASNRPVSR